MVQSPPFHQSRMLLARLQPIYGSRQLKPLLVMARMIEATRVGRVDGPNSANRPIALMQSGHIREFASRRITPRTMGRDLRSVKFWGFRRAPNRGQGAIVVRNWRITEVLRGYDTPS